MRFQAASTQRLQHWLTARFPLHKVSVAWRIGDHRLRQDVLRHLVAPGATALPSLAACCCQETTPSQNNLAGLVQEQPARVYSPSGRTFRATSRSHQRAGASSLQCLVAEVVVHQLGTRGAAILVEVQSDALFSGLRPDHILAQLEKRFYEPEWFLAIPASDQAGFQSGIVWRRARGEHPRIHSRAQPPPQPLHANLPTDPDCRSRNTGRAQRLPSTSQIRIRVSKLSVNRIRPNCHVSVIWENKVVRKN